MRFSAGAFILLLTAACWWLPAQPKASEATIDAQPPGEKLTYTVEWRLIHAGTVTVEAKPGNLLLRIISAGIVSSLFKVDDSLQVHYDEPDCAASSLLESMEGTRHRESRVTYDQQKGHAFFVERDLAHNALVRESNVEIPTCVFDALGALAKLRVIKLAPGQSTQLPVSDGRRFANVKVDAQERQDVKTAGATYHAIRYQAALLNGVIYQRKGRVFVWLTDDARHLPVQIQIQMSFPVGTVTLQLEKEERT
jgi:hypothetical protein